MEKGRGNIKTKANVAENGTVTVAGLPFKTGEQVEVTTEPLKEQKEVKDQFPLEASVVLGRTNTTALLKVWRLKI